MNTFEIDTGDLSTEALSILRAAMAHAQTNVGTHHHAVPLGDLLRAAGMSTDIAMPHLKTLVEEVKHAPLFSYDLDALTLEGTPAFDGFEVTQEQFEFTLAANALSASEPKELVVARRWLSSTKL